MKYDVTDNPMLSDEAKAVAPDILEAHNEVAEQLLGLTAFEVIDNDTDRAWNDEITRYVAMQVSHQIGSFGEDTSFKSANTTGPLSASFRTEAGTGRPLTLHAMAADGLAALLTEYDLIYPEAETDSTVDGYLVLQSKRPTIAQETQPWHSLIR